jgi:SAM-dependent methyltransferase
VDAYTARTKAWLDKRYTQTDGEGVYFAHQNIYGFRNPHVEEHSVKRYVITFQIIKALAHLRFRNLMDVGGSEGYTASLAGKMFGCTAATCDLSEEACKRAREIYNIPAFSADIMDLPFEDNAFDVVLSSETLEHVPEFESAARELLRVCRRALVITVPHDPKEAIDRNLEGDALHTHIQCLNLNSFDFFVKEGYEILSRSMYSPLLRGPLMAVQAERIDDYRFYPKIVVDCYNSLVPMFRRLFGRRTLALVVQLDDFISRRFRPHRQMLFIILKDRSCYSDKPLRDFSFYDILDFIVPHYLRVAPAKGSPAEISNGIDGGIPSSC